MRHSLELKVSLDCSFKLLYELLSTRKKKRPVCVLSELLIWGLARCEISLISYSVEEKNVKNTHEVFSTMVPCSGVAGGVTVNNINISGEISA